MSKKKINEFQEEFAHNEDERNHFVNATVEDNSDGDDTNKIQISLPKKDKKTGIEEIMITQLVVQQNLFLNAQKKLCNLQIEIDTEEVKKRYLTLDLNNEQVSHNETKDILVTYRKGFRDLGMQLLFAQLYILFFSLYVAFIRHDWLFGMGGLTLVATSIRKTLRVVMNTATFLKKDKDKND